jgi:hypothetical protein
MISRIRIEAQGRTAGEVAQELDAFGHWLSSEAAGPLFQRNVRFEEPIASGEQVIERQHEGSGELAFKGRLILHPKVVTEDRDRIYASGSDTIRITGATGANA